MQAESTFNRRRFTDHAPLPGPVNPYAFCLHDDPYCTECANEGTILHSNHDIESRAWGLRTSSGKDVTGAAFFTLSVFALALGVATKHRDNPTHFTTDRLAAVSATRD